ncbi:nucleotide-binding universal stress UspA family protein [Streptomyces canus]|uniref:Nucleotide-binding universal stress UspA family protein n=1 Tax=Streptomyces canus TaxID=58343 RepID=A0AAW8F5Y5_9ACTN|nr:nucleotide-binding universal stress UspA family protein [Streptomyces canus]
MSASVTVGLDGSPEGHGDAERAAREAELRGLPLRLAHVWEPVPEPMAQAPLLRAETQAHGIRRGPIGVHIGSVTHAVPHRATAPVAVVAHD